MNIGYFNARGEHNGVEHWFDLEIEELRRRGHNVRVFSLRGTHPNSSDIDWMDIAHLHFAQVGQRYKRMGVPFIVSPHANDIWVDNGANLFSVSRHPKCLAVTYQSFYHKKKFEEWGIEKPLVYLPMCCRTELFKRKTPYSSRAGAVAGGRLIPKKGLDRLKDVENLTIFGEGPLKDNLSHVLPPSTKFTGFLDGNELKDLFEKSSVYLFPAIVTPDGDSDGIPNTIKEAMLMELPVIASPVAGIPELENIELLNDWNNVNDILDGCKKRNWKGRQEILKTYSPKSCVDRIEKIIEENL